MGVWSISSHRCGVGVSVYFYHSQFHTGLYSECSLITLLIILNRVNVQVKHFNVKSFDVGSGNQSRATLVGGELSHHHVTPAYLNRWLCPELDVATWPWQRHFADMFFQICNFLFLLININFNAVILTCTVLYFLSFFYRFVVFLYFSVIFGGFLTF